jgi:type I restriction enzyme S subunit
MFKFRWETEFKETEIGEIPKDWEITNLGDNRFFKILSSGIKKFEGFKEYLSTSSVEGSEIVKIEEFITYNKRPSRANMQPVENSVWFARMINSPKFLKANKDLIENKILSTGFLGIQTKEKETCDYLFYYIQTKEFQEYKDAYVTGAVQESLTNENAKELIVPFPPPSEQSRIATVLSYFDDLIENKKRQNEILEKTAMAIFKSWFIDFEPFKNEEFVYNEELGREMPKGWEVKRLGEVIKIESGGSAPQKEEYFIGGKNPFVRVKHLTNYPCVEEADFITDEAVKQHNLKLYNEGSIIFQRSGESIAFGRVNILPFDAYIVNHLAAIPNLPSNKLLMEFLFFTLKNILIEAIEERSGTALPYIRVSDIENKKIPIPPPPFLQSFHSLVEPLFQKIILNQKQIMTLRKIRDTLLPLLVFGKLRVEEV